MESTTNTPDLNKDDRKEILHKLNQAMAFEQFLHKKYIGHKRFSLEGAQTLIPMIHFLIERGSKQEDEKFFFGMAHRGRIIVLSSSSKTQYSKFLEEIEWIFTLVTVTDSV